MIKQFLDTMDQPEILIVATIILFIILGWALVIQDTTEKGTQLQCVS